MVPIERKLSVDQTELKKLYYKAFNCFLENLKIGKMFWKIDPQKIIPQKDILEYTAELDLNIKLGKGLILSGGLGVGKTSILSYIAQIAFRIGRFGGRRWRFGLWCGWF